MVKNIVLWLLVSCLSLYAEALAKRTQVMMGTYASVSLSKENLYLSKDVFKRLKDVENSLSSYDVQADIFKLNNTGETSISSDTYEALALSKEYYQKTDGYFDISIGSITRGLFHFGEDEVIPSKKARLYAKVDFKGLHFDKERAWIHQGVKLDLGGMGKGFGVDKAKEVLINKSVKEGVIALSGDIFCLHRCEMSVQDPFSENILASFVMADEMTSISTSGNYRRYVKSTDYNHLINPKTKSPQKTFASITLISSSYSNSDLDAYATAASVMPKVEAFRFLNRHDLGYLIVSNDKLIYKNEMLSKFTNELKIRKYRDLLQKEYIKVVPSRTQNSKKPRL